MQAEPDEVTPTIWPLCILRATRKAGAALRGPVARRATPCKE